MLEQYSIYLPHATENHKALKTIRLCLVSKKFCKIFQIPRHIEYLDACMEKIFHSFFVRIIIVDMMNKIKEKKQTLWPATQRNVLPTAVAGPLL
jgi:hypothetical protein